MGGDDPLSPLKFVLVRAGFQQMEKAQIGLDKSIDAA
jgi:hypothetical protein